MVAAARLAFELALPNEEPGYTALPKPFREIEWLRVLFERAVGGFYSVALYQTGWRVNPGKTIRWPQDNPTLGIEAILPSMKTDIVLEQSQCQAAELLVDTKFTGILTHWPVSGRVIA